MAVANAFISKNINFKKQAKHIDSQFLANVCFIQVIYLNYSCHVSPFLFADMHMVRDVLDCYYLLRCILSITRKSGSTLSYLIFHIDLPRSRTREKKSCPNDETNWMGGYDATRRPRASITTVRCAWRWIWRPYYNNCFGNCCCRLRGPTHRAAFPAPPPRSRVAQCIITTWSATPPCIYATVYRCYSHDRLYKSNETESHST